MDEAEREVDECASLTDNDGKDAKEALADVIVEARNQTALLRARNRVARREGVISGP